jgi:hypothetical protein
MRVEVYQWYYFQICLYTYNLFRKKYTIIILRMNIVRQLALTALIKLINN